MSNTLEFVDSTKEQPIELADGRLHCQHCRHSLLENAARCINGWFGEGCCGDQALREVVSRNADAFAREVLPVVEAIRVEGNTTLRAVAAELNARGIRTRRGGNWHVSNVKNLLDRIKAVKARARD